jgi:hypothetical protein
MRLLVSNWLVVMLNISLKHKTTAIFSNRQEGSREIFRIENYT